MIKLNIKYVIPVILFYIIWSSLFIYKSSFIAIDGNRYFSLFDDAMISMRYAYNFAIGNGLVWNYGEYVQGYTNFLMTILMSIGFLLLSKTNVILYIQILGIIFVLLTAFISTNIYFEISRNNLQENQFGGLLVFIGILGYYPLSYWSLMGMETGLLTFLITYSFYAAIHAVNLRKPKYVIYAAITLSLAHITRTDSTIIAFIIFTYLFLNKHLRSNTLFWSILIYILVALSLLFFQKIYYGDFLPNTYTLKLTGMPWKVRFENGVNFIKPYLFECSILFIIVIIDYIFEVSKVKLLILSSILSLIIYQVYVGGDPWDYWRIMSPCMPVAIVLFVVATISLSLFLASAKSVNEYVSRQPLLPNLSSNIFISIIVFVVCFLVINNKFISQMMLLSKPYQVYSNTINVNKSIILNQLLKPTASIGVFWAGAIPFYVNNYAIDFLGKSDRYVANLLPDIAGSSIIYGMYSVPGHNKYDLSYSIGHLNPTYIEGLSWGREKLSTTISSKYVECMYLGQKVILLKNSDDVNWGLIEGVSANSCSPIGN